jgi:O-antigen/teichoic acid export membrane protein
MSEDDSYRKQLFEGAGIIGFGIGFELLFSFVAKVSVARYLGSADFGSFSIGLALIMVATLVSTIGLQNGVARTIPRTESEDDEWNAIFTGVLVSLVASLIVMTLIFLFAEPIVAYTSQQASLANVIHISALGVPLLTVSNMAVGVGRGHKRASIKVLINNILRPATFLAGTVVVLLFGINSVTATYVLPISYIPGTALGIYYLSKQFDLRSFRRSFSFRYELLVFSAPLMVSGFMRQIMSRLDTFMIAVFESTSQVGIYNAVYPLSKLSTVFLAAFGFIAMPIFSSIDSGQKNQEISSIYVFTTKWIVIGSTPVFILFLLFPTEIISVIFGQEYISGNVVLPILAIGFFSHTILGPNTNALVALGKSKTILVFAVMSAISNILLNFLLIPPYGIFGAAVATTLSYTGLNLLNSVELYRVEHVIPLNRTAGLLIVSTIATGVVVRIGLARFQTSPLLTLLYFGLIFGLLYLILLSVTNAVTPEDVSELLTLVRKDG